MEKLTTNNRMKTKAEVEHELKRAIWWMNKMASLDDIEERTDRPSSFYTIISSLLKRLLLGLDDLPDLSSSDGFEVERNSEGDIVEVEGSKWCYEIRINAYGVTLQMVKLQVMHDDEPYLYISEERSYNVMDVKSRRLTMEEFGKLHGVEGDTVRQWIRRGKFPMAIKFGTDWRIPELAISAADDDFRLYYIEGDLMDPPEELVVAEKYNMISIVKQRENRRLQWRLELELDGEMIDEMEMLTKDKERIERYLVSQPAAESSHGNIAWITEKGFYPNHVWGDWMSREEYNEWERELRSKIG